MSHTVKINHSGSIEEKIYFAKLRPDTEAHIKTNLDICITCVKKECTRFCPSNVFHWSTIDDTLIVGYENCIECGICTIGCPYGAIDYSHPKASHGIF